MSYQKTDHNTTGIYSVTVYNVRNAPVFSVYISHPLFTGFAFFSTAKDAREYVLREAVGLEYTTDTPELELKFMDALRRSAGVCTRLSDKQITVSRWV